MKCPKCGEGALRVHGSFAGHQDIDFTGEDGEDFVVMDSEPTDFEWGDHDDVECLECGHDGSALDFEGDQGGAQ